MTAFKSSHLKDEYFQQDTAAKKRAAAEDIGEDAGLLGQSDQLVSKIINSAIMKRVQETRQLFKKVNAPAGASNW